MFLHWITHQEVLCINKSVLKISNVTDVVIKIVNFIGVRALNHSLLDSWRTMKQNKATYATIQTSNGLALAKY